MGSAGIFQELHAAIIPVRDMKSSREWYEGVLGLEPVKVSETGMLTVYGTGGPSYVCIYVPAPGQEKPGYLGGGSFPNFRAADIAKVHTHLTEHGVRCTPIDSGPDLSWFTLFDPDGNRIDCCQYGPGWLP